jgi:hypothetical protein
MHCAKTNGNSSRYIAVARPIIRGKNVSATPNRTETNSGRPRFSFEEVDTKNRTVYGRFNHGMTIFECDVYNADEIRKWAKGVHHNTFVKVQDKAKGKEVEHSP